MNIGQMDHRLRIEQRSTSQDATYGTPAATWTTFATVWGQVQDVLPSRGESQPQELRIAERPARVRIRYVAGVTSAMRVVDLSRGNRTMKILTQPAEIGRKEALEFMAAEYTTEGNAE